MSNDDDAVAIDALMLIVVGAHLRAEIHDRPLAQQLCDRLMQWQERSRASSDCPPAALRPVICTDVWFLNNPELLERPVIALGEPGVNAATAYLSNRLPTALVIDNQFRIHLDPEFLQAQACVWGATPQATATAVEYFVERYLDAFMHEAGET